MVTEGYILDTSTFNFKSVTGLGKGLSPIPVCAYYESALFCFGVVLEGQRDDFKATRHSKAQMDVVSRLLDSA